MQKFESCKLAVFVLSLTAVTFVAACQSSSPSSSKSEPLVNPTGNYIGAYLFDVDPHAETVNISPVASDISAHTITGNGIGNIPNVTISTIHGRYIKPTVTAIPGIETVSAQATTPVGTGTLSYVPGTGITWTAPTDTEGPAVSLGTAGTGLISPLVTLTSGGGTTIIIRVIRGCGTNGQSCLPTGITTDNAIVITKADPNWNGTDTISFDAKITWNNPAFELNNVRLAVKKYTNNNVKLLNYSQCTGVNWSTCGANPAAVTYVADTATDDPMTYTTCNVAGICTTGNFYSSILPECGSVVGHWTLQGSGGGGYKFWTYLYGDKKAVGDITTDSRYSDDTASIYIRTSKIAANTYYFPAEGTASKSMAAGEWFYVHYYVDAPGNNRPIPYDSTNNGVMHIEDTGNIAAYQGGTNSTASYWFLDGGNNLTLRWDPALLEGVSKGTNPYDPPSNNRVNKFTTQRGTALKIITSTTAVGWNIASNWAPDSTISNRIGFMRINTGSYPSFPIQSVFPNPGDGIRGLTGGTSMDAFLFSLHAKEGAKGGAFIRPMYDPSTVIMGRNTLGDPGSPGGTPIPIPRKQTNWPDWCWSDLIPNYSTCNVQDLGFYNAERTYVCIN